MWTEAADVRGPPGPVVMNTTVCQLLLSQIDWSKDWIAVVVGADRAGRRDARFVRSA